jgi:hypothetical protein
MLGPNLTGILDSRRSDITLAERIVISADDACQGTDGFRVLYVLCFGVAFAIIANAVILLCFAESGTG